MSDWTRFHLRSAKFWTDLVAAQIDATVTIAQRVRILADGSTAKARRRAARETTTMVVEKIVAAGAGGLAGARSAARSAPSLLGGPLAAAATVTKIGRDMFAPARRRVRANARRLTKSDPD